MPSRSRRKRWLHLPHEHGKPIHLPRYDVVAGVLFAVAGMLIWTCYRVPTHAVVISLPVESELGQPFQAWPEHAPTHLLSVTADGQLIWDERPVGQRELLNLIESSVVSSPRHGIVFEPDAYARYELVAKVIAILDMANATDERFCLGGLRQYANTADEADGRIYLHSVPYRPEWTPTPVDRVSMVGCDEAFR